MVQSMLLLGAFVILSTITLSVNRMILSQTEEIIESEAQISAIGLAQQLMEEVTSRDFDENTTGTLRVQSP
ncbi:MAG: hypothetical protein DRP95_01980, partial [Candidatus Latescibacterota bacterium]